MEFWDFAIENTHSYCIATQRTSNSTQTHSNKIAMSLGAALLLQ
jgi:hypothetical protein